MNDPDRSECGCANCVANCKNIPGWFLPGEIAPAAEALGLSVDEFFNRHLVIDYWMDQPHVFVLRPRTLDEPGGSVVPLVPPRARCVFLDEHDRCGIHRTKPHECATASHRPWPEDWHKRTADAWRDRQRDVAALNGGQTPDVDEPSMMDMLGLLLRKTEVKR